MQEVSDNNKRIAKNTLLLYIRMIVVTLVSLYTVRLTLMALGLEDYGVYNVVAGIVNFTGVITIAMVQATQRFLSYDLGQSNVDQFQRSYSMMINVFVLVCLVVTAVFEIIGPFYINEYVVVAPERLYAVQWVFQFALFDFILNTLIIPDTAAIVAYERMGIYAYFTIVDVLLKLLVVFSLYIIPYDKLITYGALNAVALLLRNIALNLFCRKKLPGCKFFPYWDGEFFKRISQYIGWSLLGSTNAVMMTHGQTLLLNFFFGPLVNAAKAVSDKIRGTIYMLVSNFYMAVTPQIVKTYSVGDVDYTRQLVINSSRYAYFLLLVVSLPLIAYMPNLLVLWLGERQVSPDMVAFGRLSLVFGLIQVLETPITKAVQATGEIKKYEIIVGAITLSFIPVCYIAFKIGGEAIMSMVLLCVIYFIAQLYRIYHVTSIIQIKYRDYCLKVLIPLIVVTVVCLLAIQVLPCPQSSSLIKLLFCITVSVIMSMLIVGFGGLDKKERKLIVTTIKAKAFQKRIFQ